MNPLLVLVAVVAFAAGWLSAQLSRRAAGDRDASRLVPVPGPVVIPFRRPGQFDWAAEIPELADPTGTGGPVGAGRLGAVTPPETP